MRQLNTLVLVLIARTESILFNPWAVLDYMGLSGGNCREEEGNRYKEQ